MANMRVPINWLEEYASSGLSVGEIAELLTMAGLEVEDLEEVYGEPVLLIKVPHNRPDCLSILGIARELCGILSKTLKLPELATIKTNSQVKYKKIEVLEPQLCPRYSGLLFKDVKVAESPGWLQRRLIACGLRPINNIVDVTNYVLLELGQPLHSFDFDALTGDKIVVRCAQAGENILALDDVNYKLSASDLVIADSYSPVAIAGIMGGKLTGVSQQTQAVFLEAANFNPICIRKTAKRLSATSESSYRFERGVDPSGTVVALQRAARLLSELSGAEAAGEIIDICSVSVVEPLLIDLRVERAIQVLGVELSAELVAQILARLQFEVDLQQQEQGLLKVSVPTFRRDIKEEIDLIEEIVRLYGYDNIPNTLPKGTISVGKDERGQELELIAKNILVSCGLYEVCTFSLINSRLLELFKVDRSSGLYNFIKIRNPVSEEHNILRTTLLPSLLKVVAHNVSHFIKDVFIFELGRVYFNNPVEHDKPIEARRLAAAILGDSWLSAWKLPKEAADFYSIKGILENLLSAFGFSDSDYKFVAEGELFKMLQTYPKESFHPGRSAELLLNDIPVGVLGELGVAVAEAFELPRGVYVFELDFDLLSKLYEERLAAGLRKYKGLPKYPAIKVDIALSVPEDMPAQKVKEYINEYGGKLLKNIKLFDYYSGEQLPKGFKSLAFSLEYQAADRTLTAAEVEAALNELLSKLKQDLGISRR